MGTTFTYPMLNPTQKPITPFSLNIIFAVSLTCNRCPSPTAPPTCILLLITSSGYAEVCDTNPAIPPESNSAHERNGGGLSGGDEAGLGRVVYCAIIGCRKTSPAVS